MLQVLGNAVRIERVVPSVEAVDAEAGDDHLFEEVADGRKLAERADLAESLRQDGVLVLAAVSRVNWSDDMTPWPTEAVAKWESRCGGMADLYLSKLENEIVPAVCDALPFPPSGLYLAGYSLGGLFAIYALWNTPLFTRAASASGSLWYPDIAEYCCSREPAGRPDRVYLSLGSKETKGRGRTASLRSNTEAVAARLRSLGADVTFEENPGGHTHEADRRMAKGIIALLK